MKPTLLLADDLSWSDLGCYGADLHETSHLDRLAQHGMDFTDTCAMSVCSPSRAALLLQQLNHWRTQVGAAMPTANLAFK